MKIEVTTNQEQEVLDITDLVAEHISDDARAMNIFVAHTTCALTTADLDPGTDEDLLEAIDNIIPKLKYRHPHNPSHAHVSSHLASSIIGPSVTIPVKDGKLVLGTWQRIILIELDGPKQRQITVTNV